MNQSPSPSTCTCTNQATAPETLKISNEPFLLNPTVNAMELQDAIECRMGQAISILSSLLAEEHFRYIGEKTLVDLIDGARLLMEEASVLNIRQWEIRQGGAQS